VYDIGAQLFPQLVEQKLPFFVQNRPFKWIDIGRVSDYWSVLQRVLKGEVAEMQMPGHQLKRMANQKQMLLRLTTAVMIENEVN